MNFVAPPATPTISTANLKIPSLKPKPQPGVEQSPDINAVITDSHDPDSPSAPIRSSLALSEWRGSVTTFNGFTGTRPTKELEEARWDDVRKLLCPNKPAILQNKEQGQYVVPCLLKEAPLVGLTLEAAKNNGTPTTGKMRSKNHVTEASMLLMDFDGLAEADFMECQEKMIADGISLQAYTTYSYGSPEKKGMRARLVIPINRPVTTEEYFAAWHGADKLYLNGQAGKADSSGANMYQQQGTWCCNLTRLNQAKSWFHSDGVASADVLIEIGQVTQSLQKVKVTPSPINAKNESLFTTNSTYLPSDANKIADACLQIGAFRDTKGAGQCEPLWHDCLGVIGHCQNGKDISRDWSSGYSEYDEAETAKKIAYRMKTPPTTCKQFSKTNPAGCKGCIQQCNSPITLGRDAPDALAAMQQQFGLINLDGKIYVFDRNILNARTDQGLAKKLILSNRSDGGLLIERALKAGEYPLSDTTIVIKDYWSSPQTMFHTGVEFNPLVTSGNNLNLWVGPTIIPKEGLWSRIQSFLLDVICDGDEESYRYLIKYIAHAMQRPEEKPGVMIILLGGQGIGKGTLGRIFQKTWSATYIQVNNIDDVTGSFNASLERAFIVFMDEALFSGNRRASDALKSLITEPILQINEKYQPARQIRSYHRFIAATNADHFKNTERDDRRDFTLRVSESRKGDHTYWDLLNHEIDNGGVEAMVHDMLAMDLSEFNVRNKPNTKELVEQKIHSLDPIQRWWHDGLFDGDLANGDKSRSDTWPDFMSTQEAIEGIIAVNGGKMYKKPSAIIISQVLQKLCPSAKQHQQQVQIGGRHRGYLLPSLQQARAEFELYIGGVVEWPEECVTLGPLGDDSVDRAPDF